MKLISALSLFIAFFATQAQAAGLFELSPEAKIARAQKLSDLARETCQVQPAEDMAPYTAYAYDRVIGQVIMPDLKMLNTAFLVGFTAFRSKNLDSGLCVITFLGRRNDPSWEKNHDYFARAKQAGVLPAQMFAGFDFMGNVLLKPIEDLN